MTLLVQKFGGTSVGSIERIQAVASRVAESRRAGNQVVVVVSAMSGVTNKLVEMANAIQARPDNREMDVLLSTGEQTTIALLSMALLALGCPARSYTGSQVRILTDDAHSNARILDIDQDKVRQDLDSGKVVVIAGFQGVTADGDISTLGRGGSDTTAVAMAAALHADECQIFTDVDGVYTTDPRVVENARRLDSVTFEEMLEMSSLGAKVLQIRSVEFASKYNVPLRVLSSFEDGPGTFIGSEDETMMEMPLISGIAFTRDEAKLSILGVPDIPGMAHRVFGPISEAGIEVDVILQNIGNDQTNDITFTVQRKDTAKASEILEVLAKEIKAEAVQVDDKVAKVSLVGVGMRSHAGIASRMFEALAKESINIQLITTSEIKISIVIEEKYLELAVRALHDAFELGNADANAKQ
ncbi:MAG: aspartate kinase [Gammaproteobacteria bacterium]|nr:aspartate kinase [Gammaproteobacteria bacterium]MAY02203.1 aspartate kinase [Gammaproteobacteria bacterium]|tara:strand:- start:8754 stop:9992 length:1239 start_codon:yes stop_codon:yes gene_type:complete